MKKLLLVAFIGATLSMTALPVFADGHAKNEAKSEKQAKTAVLFRKSVLQLVRSNMGPLGAMAKGDIPMNADVIGINSKRIEFLSGMMHDYFALNTTAYAVETDAKNSIWKNYKDFSQKIDDMVNAASSLNVLVKADKSDEFRKGIGALGATCKACHDDYKVD